MFLKLLQISCIGTSDLDRVAFFGKAGFALFGNADPATGNGVTFLNKLILQGGNASLRVHLAVFSCLNCYRSLLETLLLRREGVIAIVYLNVEDGLSYVHGLLDSYPTLRLKPILVVATRRAPSNLILVDPNDVAKMCKDHGIPYVLIDPAWIDSGIVQYLL
jgi:hypothetical protein